MSDEHSLDILGIKPVGKAVEKITAGTVDGAGAFLSRICLPAAEEFGLLLRDRVHNWRTQNLVAITRKAEQNLQSYAGLHASPRLVNRVVEEASWIDDSEVQEMWAGLLSSSCTETGDDDSNLLFIGLLSSLTKLEANILRFACERSSKSCGQNGLITVCNFEVSIEQLFDVAGVRDVQRLDRELDHLRVLGLLDGGFESPPRLDVVSLTPTTLAVHMYVRCQGTRISPAEYFGIPE
jgi:hypothetical protein